MYDILHVPKTAAWARRAVLLSKINPVYKITDSIQELAKTDTFPYSENRTNVESEALTYIKDWNGRCVLVDRDTATMMTLSLLWCKEKDFQAVTVLTDFSRFGDWYHAIRSYFPEKKISIIGGTKTIKTLYLPSDVKILSEPDTDADFYICSTQTAFNTTTLNRKTDQFIIDEFSNISRASTLWSDQVKNICLESYRVLFLVNLNSWISERVINVENAFLEYMSFKGRPSHAEMLYPSMPIKFASPFSKGSTIDIKNEMIASGYQNDIGTIYKLTGTFLDLLADKVNARIITHMLYIKEYHDMPMRSPKEFKDHMTHNWGFIKASAMRMNSHYAMNLAVTSNRTLIVTKNKHLIRSLIQDSNYIHLESNPNPDKIIASYLSPNPSAYKYGEPIKMKIRPIILSPDLLHSDLLTMTNTVILAELPETREEYISILSKIENHQCLVSIPIIAGSFEEEWYEYLNKSK